MVLHLLRAPDYAPADYFAVCDLLLSMNLPGWVFIIPEVEIDPEDVYPNWGGGRGRTEAIRFDYHSPVEKVMYNPDRGAPLSWRELFDICSFYRQMRQIVPSSVVVLLTSRPNALNWFSAFDKQQNVFIHTADWESFIPCESKYPIAYEVLANSLQLQMALEFDSKEDCLHQEAIGCMNDFCQNKAQIALKLRTGDICGACLQRLKTAEVPDVVIQGALRGYDLLRKQMLFRQGFQQATQPGPVEVDRHYRIVFPDQGNLEVKMSCLARTVYLFFLRHLTGVCLVDLCDYRAELMAIYERISGTGDREVMRQSIARLVDIREGTLNQNLSRIRRRLIDTLGETLAEPYLITGEAGERYRIRLRPDLIHWAH